jgi:hypothetical protein
LHRHAVVAVALQGKGGREGRRGGGDREEKREGGRREEEKGGGEGSEKVKEVKEKDVKERK